MKAHIYIEGGGSSKDLQIRCREAFRKLLEKAGFARRLPRLTACGSRNEAYADFVTAHAAAEAGTYVALLVDSEDPVTDVNDPWGHLVRRDGWPRPAGARDQQAFLMVTAMETWVACDRAALERRYGQHLQTGPLPALSHLEAKPRDVVFRALVQATRAAPSPYGKGAESFRVVELLDPPTLRTHLPSFARFVSVLDAEL